MTRLLLFLGLLALAAPASAQGYYGDDYYDDPYDRRSDDGGGVGVRIGLGLGAYVYDGPDLLYGDPAFQDDVVATNFAVTGEVSFPLGSENLRGRILAGLLNIGADDDRADAPGGTNPFLTSETILAEADLLYYLVAPGRGPVSPYLFTGLAGLFATGDAAPGVSRTALALPVGAGVEFAVSRNLSLYGEASYRFGLTNVGNEVAATTAAITGTAGRMGDECDEDPTKPECKPCDHPDTANPACKPCDDPSTANPDCDDVDGDSDGDFDSRFNSALFTGGLRLGFAPAPRAYIPPPPPPVVVTPPPPPVVTPPPPRVCELVELNPVYFDYGTATVSQRARALLDENVELLLANPECCIFIDGFVDNTEMDRFGMPLAGRRAQAVYDYYLSRGVAASKMQIRNRGEGSPNCDKEDPGLGCERNRRVETVPVDCDRFLYLLENPSANPY